MFQDVNEYFIYANLLSFSQQELIFRYLTPVFREKVINDMRSESRREFYQKVGLDVELKDIENEMGYNLMEIKNHVYNGKCKYIPKEDWDEINERLFKYSLKMKYFVIGGMKAEKENDHMVCLIKK